MSIPIMSSPEEKELVLLLQDLVSIDSVNPSFSKTGAGEAKIADYIEAFLKEIGAEVLRQRVFEGRDNVLGRIGGRDRSRTLILEAHMDTVSVQNMEIDPFRSAVKNGNIYGRGACDTKGSLSAMLFTLRRIACEGKLPPVDILFVGAADEEYRAQGIREFVRSGVKATAAVVGEPTALKVIVAHKGCFRCEITTRGKSVQSSQPDMGINAVYKMFDVIDAIRTHLTPGFERRRPHDLVGLPTINVGTIEGGSEVNTVPDRCRIEVDRRVIPGETREKVEKELTELLGSLRAKDPELSVEIGNSFFDPPLDTDRGSEIVRVAEKACRSVLGRAHVTGVPYGSDASKLMQSGVPSVVFGPGNILHAHSANEYVPVEEVIRSAEIYTQIATGFTGI